MHFEDYQIDEKTAEIINSTIESGGRIISVGTTSVRTLESAAEKKDGKWKIRAGTGNTDIFIYPGYSFKIVDSLITNFHLPRSTLLMLVSALYTREDMLRIYREAVEKEYRFFSYGDAMFIK
jgi:S-adenosylmethionine:tRNA ribosyltransferase-isomerase